MTTLRARLDSAYAKARAEFDAHLGEIVLTRCIRGYRNDDNAHTINLTTPARVRVTSTQDYDVVRESGGFIDPCWNVELLEPHAEIPGDMRSLWIEPPSYRVRDGQQENESTFELEEPLVIVAREARAARFNP